MHDDPLVVPADDPLRRLEGGLAADGGGSHRRDEVDDLVVELQHRQLPLADERVLVVAGIADQGGVLDVSRKVVFVVVAADQHLHPLRRLVVQEGVVGGPAAVDAVEVEAGAAEVGQRIRVVLPVEAGGSVEGDVVVDELPEVGVAGGNLGLSKAGSAPLASSVMVSAISVIRASDGTNGGSRNIRPNLPSCSRDTGTYDSPRCSYPCPRAERRP